MGQPNYFFTRDKSCAGVAILFKIGLDFKIEKLITDHNDGRFIYADLLINHSVFNETSMPKLRSDHAS